MVPGMYVFSTWYTRTIIQYLVFYNMTQQSACRLYLSKVLSSSSCSVPGTSAVPTNLGSNKRWRTTYDVPCIMEQDEQPRHSLGATMQVLAWYYILHAEKNVGHAC